MYYVIEVVGVVYWWVGVVDCVGVVVGVGEVDDGVVVGVVVEVVGYYVGVV